MFNEMYFSLLFSSALFVFAEYCSVKAKEIRLRVTPSCNYEVHHFDEEASYLLEWRGEDPGESGCKHGFQGNVDSFEICVDAIDFHLQEHGIDVNYYTGADNQELQKTLKKQDSPEIFCKTDVLVAVEVKTVRPYSWSKVNTSSSYFTLNVTGTSLVTGLDDASVDVPWVTLGLVACFGIFGAISLSRKFRGCKGICRPRQRADNQRRFSIVSQASYGAGNTDSTQESNLPIEITSVHVQPQDSDSPHHAQAPETSSGFNFPIQVNNSEENVLDNSNYQSGGAENNAYNPRTMPTAPPPPPAPLSTGARVPEMAPPSYSEVMNMK